MHALNVLTLILAIAAGIIGLLASYYWLEASKIEIDPGWRTGLPRSAADALKPIEPVEPHLSQMSWISATMKAVGESAALNKIAARLTAVAVILSTVSGILSASTSYFR